MSTSTLRVHTESPAQFFASGFKEIATTRMAGLPICRTDISVEALEFQRYGKHWLGVVVTPWSLLVVLACGDKESWPVTQAGKIRDVTLPAGDFSFLGMDDPILGQYLACSLMSPLDTIPDQVTARAVAVSALRLMLRSDLPEPAEEQGTPLRKRVVPIRAAEAPEEKQEKTVLEEATQAAPDSKKESRRDFFTRYWK